MGDRAIGLGLAEIGAFSPDGKLLAMTGSGPRVRVFDLEHRLDLWRRGIVSHPRALLWSADGSTLYVIGMGGRIRALDPRSGEVQRRFEHPTVDVDAEWVLTADGDLVCASFGRPLQVIDPGSGRVVKSWSAAHRRMTKKLLVLPSAQGIAAFSDTPPKDDHSPVGPTNLHLWRPRIESEPSTTIRFESASFMAGVGVSPDGATIALFENDFGRMDTRLTLVDVDSATVSAGPALDIGERSVSGAAWSPDGHRVALRTGDGVVVLKTSDWSTTQRLPAKYALSVGWSPDGQWLFVGSASAYLVDASGDLPAPPAPPAWKEEDGLAVLMDLDAEGRIDTDQMLSQVESLLLNQLAAGQDLGRFPAPVRAVLLSSYWEASVTWDGVPTTAENLREYLPSIADAYRSLGMKTVAAVFERLAASLTELLNRAERPSVFFPARAPFAQVEADLEKAGLADAADRRIDLIRRHRGEFARLK